MRATLRSGWSLGAMCVCFAGACTTDTNVIKVRPIRSAASAIQPGTSALTRAQGLLNLGNPGLALEAFRKIQREQPSADALAGISACYVAIGRDDLARINLEAALALEPKSPELLNSIALVMDRLGLKAEAANARLQARVSAARLMPVLAAPAKEVDQAEADETLSPTIPTKDLEVVLKSEPLMPALEPIEPVDLGVVQAVEEARRLAEANDLSSSVTVKLPPARGISTARPAPDDRAVARAEVARGRVETFRPSSSVTVRLPPARMASSAARVVFPRLERLSSKEVALVTNGRPFWAPSALNGVRASLAHARWTPLRRGHGVPNIRLLNAARVEGLASAARAGLIQRGWRKIEIGNYAEVRARSFVLYPADKKRIGRSLARHFGIGSAQSRGRTVTVVIGRDLHPLIDG